MSGWQLLSTVTIIGLVQWLVGVWIIERLENKIKVELRLSAEIAKKLSAMDATLQSLATPRERDPWIDDLIAKHPDRP